MAINKKKFGEILVEAGVISETALRQALDRQQITGWRIGKILEAMSVIQEKDVAVALSRQYGFRTAKDFARHPFPPELLDLVPLKLVKKGQIFPLKREGSSLHLAMINPLDLPLIDEVSTAAHLHIIPVVTTSDEISKAIRYHYDERNFSRKERVMIDNEEASLLVVDASNSSRLKVAKLLQEDGFLVEDVSSHTEAKSRICHNVPHLVLVDTENPEQVNPLRLFQELGDIPFFAIGPNPVREEVALLDAGFVDFIHRPYHHDRLLARIKSALRMLYGERKDWRKGRSA